MLYCLFILIVTVSLTQGQWNETVIRQTRPLPSSFFDEIIVDGAFDVFLSQSERVSTPTVELETSVNAQKQIVVEILENHILSIHMKSSLIVHKNINVYIKFGVPLRHYTIKGTGNTVTSENGLFNKGNEKFILDNRGTANVAMQLNINEFEVYLSGTGNSRFWGHVREQMVLDTKGVGDVNAMNLLSKKVKVHSTGVSTVRIAAQDDIQMEVTGVSTVYYRLLNAKKPTKAISMGLGQIVSVS